jgi:hypothetical protein
MISCNIWIKTGTQLKIWDNLPNLIKFGCIITQTIINGGDRFDYCPENSMPYDQCCSIKIKETGIGKHRGSNPWSRIKKVELHTLVLWIV